jgi:hypothetical protein
MTGEIFSDDKRQTGDCGFAETRDLRSSFYRDGTGA